MTSAELRAGLSGVSVFIGADGWGDCPACHGHSLFETSGAVTCRSGCTRQAFRAALYSVDNPCRVDVAALVASFLETAPATRIVANSVPTAVAVSDADAEAGEPTVEAPPLDHIPDPTDADAPFDAAAGSVEGRGGRAHVIQMSGVPAKSVEWLWTGRLPAGMVSVLDGPPGAGKSTVVIDIVARLTTGRPLPTEVGSRPAVDVVLLGHEDSPEHTIRPRLDAAGADPFRVHLLLGIGERAPRLPDDGAEIERVVRETGAKLLVIDPVSAYLGTADLHRDNDVRGALAPLATIAERTGAAVLMLRHLRKSGGVDAMGRGLGSVAIIALARAGLMLLQDPDDPEAKILAWSKMSVALRPASLRWRWKSGTAAPQIEWDGTTDLSADDILARQDRAQRGGGGEAASITDAAETWLMDQLTDRGRVSAKEILEAGLLSGHSGRALRRAKDRLGVQSRRVNTPGAGGRGEWQWRASVPREVVASHDGESPKAPQIRMRGALAGHDDATPPNSLLEAELGDQPKAPLPKAPPTHERLGFEEDDTAFLPSTREALR